MQFYQGDACLHLMFDANAVSHLEVALKAIGYFCAAQLIFK